MESPIHRRNLSFVLSLRNKPATLLCFLRFEISSFLIISQFYVAYRCVKSCIREYKQIFLHYRTLYHFRYKVWKVNYFVIQLLF
jgi:hypothetical protein